MSSKIAKIIFSLPISLLLIAITVINIRLHHSPETKVIGNDTINYELLKELHALKHALDNGADASMQKIYPEGYLFMNSIYALAWCTFMDSLSPGSVLLKEGYKEIEKSWSKINSETGRAPFDKELSIPFGAFYTGWSNYVLGRKLKLESPKARKEAGIVIFKNNCKSIATALQQRTYPASYYGMAWPADATVCIASLSLHDQLFPAQYTEVINRWLNDVKSKTENHGLIPHAVDPSSGKGIGSARGCSQSLMLIFLKDIDADFAAQQFKLYKTNFVDTLLGLSSIREYAKNESGMGDVDSGPVLFNQGSVATIVGAHTLQLYGENELAQELQSIIRAFSFPINYGDRKTHLFGLLPMADAFIAWGHSNYKTGIVHKPNFTAFHLYSTLLFVLLSLFLWVLIRSRKPSSKKSLSIPW